MSVEYDLVIVGGTEMAREVAIAARSLGARVALVEPTFQVMTADWHLQTLGQVGQLLHRSRQVHAAGFLQGQPGPLGWEQVWDWGRQVAMNLAEARSPSILSSLGIDVVVGTGEFVRRPRLAVVVGERVLRSRAYLLAMPRKTVLPPLEGLPTVRPWTPEYLGQLTTPPPLPRQLIVLGNIPHALELAQTFNRLGSRVTLLLGNERLLPQADPVAALLLQAQLEVEGIEVVSHTEVVQVRQLAGQKWIQVGSQAVEADEILVVGPRRSEVEGWNLEGVGVEVGTGGINVNHRLQTTHPRIYASEGYEQTLPPMVLQTLLRNTLFLSWFEQQPFPLPVVTLTDPPLVQVGLTEVQAGQQYGKDLVVVQQPLRQTAKAEMQAATTGFCQLITRHNGQILGVHWLGAGAEECISTTILAIQQRLTVKALARLSGITPSFAQVLQQTAIAWEHHRLQQPSFWQNLREGWLDWRRDRTL